jgi:hypothetical protein
MSNFAEKVITFNNELDYTGPLPDGIRVMNPFKENPEILPVTRAFYERFYNDHDRRKLILGINPGRLGAGATGIPFTDSKRMEEICGIPITSVRTHEPSSVFVYEMIVKYGGAEKFYKEYYISAVCPLGFIRKNPKGNWINCNYYDDEALFRAVKPFMVESVRKQLSFGIDTKTCFVLGRKNARYVKRINDEERLFGSIEVFDHPRYILQYRSRMMQNYIDDYLSKLA